MPALRWAGDAAADLRGESPKIDFRLRSSNVSVGTLLAQVGVAEGLDITAGRFDLKLAMRGASSRQILEQSEFSVGIMNGLWRIRDPNMESSMDIHIFENTISARRGKPISLEVDGRLDKTPVKIMMTTDSLASFAKRKDQLRMDLEMQFAGSDLKLSGAAPLPVRSEDLHFTLDFRGKKFSDFDDLLDVSLPPLGPYELTGQFGSRTSGYYLEKLQLKLGESTLTGKLDFQTEQFPPRLAIDLVAKNDSAR